MPKQRKAQRPTPVRHAAERDQQPRLIEGGVRPFPVEVDDGTQPSIALWVDGQSGMILAQALVDRRASKDQGATEALAALEQALQGIMPGAAGPELLLPGGRPAARPGGAVVVRTDSRLATLAQLRLARLNVVVEAADDLPMFDLVVSELMEGLAESMAEPFDWDIDPALLPPLFEAATEYADREPWELMLDHPPIAVSLGARSPLAGVETLYGSIMGAGGSVFGAAYYLSLDEYRDAMQAGIELEQAAERPLDDGDLATMTDQLRRMGAPVDSVPPDLLREMLQELAGEATAQQPTQESLVCFFDAEDETDPSYLAWLADRGIDVEEDAEVPVFLRTGRESDPREPTAEEVRALTLALSATSQFVVAHQRTLRRHAHSEPSAPLSHVAAVMDGGQAVPVEVTWPAPGFDSAAALPPLEFPR